jgi:hypothetical protein
LSLAAWADDGRDKDIDWKSYFEVDPAQQPESYKSL